MLMGIVASALSGGTTSSGLYDGATAVLDFQNGAYFVNGVAANVADLIDRTDSITGSGLVLDWNTADVPIALLTGFSSALDLEVGFSVLVEYQQYELSAYNDFLLNFWNEDFSIPGRIQFEIQSGLSEIYSYDKLFSVSDGFDREVTAAITAADGVVRKVAATTTPEKLAVSANGSVAVVDLDTGTATRTYTTYTLGGAPGDGFLSINAVIRKLICYPPVTDAQLQALTL